MFSNLCEPKAQHAHCSEHPVYPFFSLLLDLCDVIESRAEMFWFRSASLEVLCASQMVLWGVLLAADRLTVEAGESEKP